MPGARRTGQPVCRHGRWGLLPLVGTTLQAAGRGARMGGARVDAMERCGNRRPRVERLVSAWNQGCRDDADVEGDADDALIGASVEPKKRPRTRLTESEVDAIRTARAEGVSVTTLAEQFGVHRGTVWTKTRSETHLATRSV